MGDAAEIDGAEMVVEIGIRRLIAQVSAPVRFDLCLRSLADLGVTAVIELPPAGALAGLVKRELPGVTIAKLAGPDDLPAARELFGPAVLDLEASELLSAGARS